MINTKSKERKSLCEESMLVLVNILKLSSLSLAGKSLAVATAGDHQPSRKTSKKSVTKATEGAPSSTNSSSHPDGSKKARWPWSDTGSRLSYVVLPAGDQGEDGASSSSYVVHEDNTADGRFSDYIKRFHQKAENDLQNSIVERKAADYIKRFHEKNRIDEENESRRSSYPLLPPPHQLHKNR